MGTGLKLAQSWVCHSHNPMPPLPEHILQTGQTVGERFCGWVDVPVSSLETLPHTRTQLTESAKQTHNGSQGLNQGACMGLT